MTALALFLQGGGLPLRPSATHKLALGLVWLSIVAGAVVFSEPAPVDVLTLGLVVLLPLIGLVSITPPLLVLLGMMLTAAAAAFLAAGIAIETGGAAIHTGVSLYLYVATFVLAAFVAKRPSAHAGLIFNAYLWAALIASLAGIVGYLDLVPGAHDLMTRYGRATGLFKDPNVFGPFLVPALVYALSRLAGATLRQGLLLLGLLLILGLAMLLSFSRGAWFNLGTATMIYGVLHVLTVRSHRARLKFMMLAIVGIAAVAALVLVALQFDEVSDLAAERASLDQGYDQGPEGRFGGQQRAAALILANPFGIGAQQFAPHHHHEEPHNVYLAMFLNAGWIGGLLFIALVAATAIWGLRHAFVRTTAQPVFLVVYACFLAHALEGFIIDLDHWRHFYLLMALAWGLMLAKDEPKHLAPSRRVRLFAA
jgi:O-antigen ligase